MPICTRWGFIYLSMALSIMLWQKLAGMQSSEAWLTTLILSRLALCKAHHIHIDNTTDTSSPLSVYHREATSCTAQDYRIQTGSSHIIRALVIPNFSGQNRNSWMVLSGIFHNTGQWGKSAILMISKMCIRNQIPVPGNPSSRLAGINTPISDPLNRGPII